MARTSRSSQLEVIRKTQRYLWPEGILNAWMLLVLACGITHIVVFALNTRQQSIFGVGTPWLFPYGITIGSLTVALFVVFQILILSRNIIPGVMIMICILFFALYLTSTIETGILLFMGGNSVSQQCRSNIEARPVTGQSVATLAWLELDAICTGWYTVFSFALIGTILFFFMMFFAAGVSRSQVDFEDDLAR